MLDEPLSNLDAKLRVETREEIRRIQQEVKITTIFVTHDQEEAMSISDRIAVMDAGVLQQFEKPQDMYLNPVNTFVANFLGTPQINMFDGEVTDEGVFLGGNLVRARADFADKLTPIPNGTYKMGIRPEHFELVDSGVPATADRVLMTGRELQAFFHLGETPFRLLTHSDQRLYQGSEFNLQVRRAQLMIFSEDNLALAKV